MSSPRKEGGKGEELKFNQWVTYISEEPKCCPIRYFTTDYIGQTVDEEGTLFLFVA